MLRLHIWIGMLAFVGMPSLVVAQNPGDTAAGKTYWEGPASMCRQCHGANAEGGFGPDLAGRRLSAAQFTRAVREPWGIMPAFTADQISDRQIADLTAYFDSLPRVASPAPWRAGLVPTMSVGHQRATTWGCAQCHGPEFTMMRTVLGAAAIDYPAFTRLVYDHTTEMPALDRRLGDSQPVRMGNYSRLRLDDMALREIWTYISSELGFRARMQARAEQGPRTPASSTYSVTVANRGLLGLGVTAEEVTLTLTLPAGAAISTTTGAGYLGTTKNDMGEETATWRIARLGAAESQAFTITIAGSAPSIREGAVTWVRPAQKNGTAGDRVPVILPRPAQ